MTREELIELARKIVNHQGTEEEVEEMFDIFSKNVPHPSGAHLFYYPENYDKRKHNISEYSPTIEEVVDKALGYKPIILPSKLNE